MVWNNGMTQHAENKCSTQLTHGPGRVSNQGHLGERRVLNAQANHAFSKDVGIGYEEQDFLDVFIINLLTAFSGIGLKDRSVL